MKNQKHTEHLKHILSDEELIAQARRQSALLRDYEQAENELSSVKATFKARMEGLQSGISLCTRLISDGFEMRPTDCETILNEPAKGRASVYRIDTGELVRERAMDASELQMKLEDVEEEPESDDEPMPEPEEVSAPEEAPLASAVLVDGGTHQKKGKAKPKVWEFKRGQAVAYIEIESSGDIHVDASCGSGSDLGLLLPRCERIQGVVAACAEIESWARKAAADATGKTKSAAAAILSWALDLAGQMRQEARTA